MMHPALRTWREAGRHLSIAGHRIFVVELGDASAEPLVIVHGYPGSSNDFAAVAGQLAEHHRVVLLDLLGYGFSDKPAQARYSLFEQADLVESVLARLGIDSCAILAHDMGDTVVAELLHRHNHGELGFQPQQVILTNGSIFIDLAQLTLGQRGMLRLPAQALPVQPPRWLMTRMIGRSFTHAAPAPPGAIDGLVAMIRQQRGGRLLARQNRYLLERRANQPRWTTALIDYPERLSLIWGAHDPIATTAMPTRLLELRPQTDLTVLHDVGHWPQLEVPGQLAEHIHRLVG